MQIKIHLKEPIDVKERLMKMVDELTHEADEVLPLVEEQVVGDVHLFIHIGN